MNAPLRPMRDPELRPYLNSVNAWHGYVRFLGLPTLQDHPDTPMWELFVQPLLSGRAVSPDTPPNEWPQGLSVLATLHEAKRLVVLGDPGSGKSTLINWLAWLLVAGLPDRVPEWMQNMIPLPLILRELDLSGVETFDGLLEAFLKRPVAEHLRGKEDRLRELLAAGRVLVLTDGLDEVTAGQREDLRRALWDGFDRYPESYFLATSRVVGYEDCPVDWEKGEIQRKGHVDLVFSERLDQQESPLHLVFRKERNEHGQLRYILPFDDDRIRAFAHNWYRLRSLKQTADRDTADFIAALFRDETTKRLARTPQILTLMALVFRVRAQLPDGRALLYDLITEAYLDSIDKSRKLVPAQDPYPWREKRRWLARVGFEMQYRRTNSLPRGEGRATGQEKDFGPSMSAPLNHAANGEGVKSPSNPPHPNPLPEGEGARERELLASREEVRTWIAAAMQASGYSADEAFVDAYLDWVARRSGLLLPRGKGRYAFVHLSFQEYAAALYLVEHLTDADWVLAQRAGEAYPDGDPRVTAAALRQWAKDPRWQETLVFCFESFAHQPKDARRLLVWLFGENHGDFLERLEPPADNPFERPPEAPRAELLARILADPHSGLNPAERKTAFEALWHYLDSAEGRFKKLEVGADPKVLNLVLSAPTWAQRFWRRAAETGPKILNLRQAERLDLQVLSKLTSLQQLDLSQTSIADLTPLADLLKLQTFFFPGTAVTDLTPLTGLRDLQFLNFSSTGVTDLSPLAGLYGLDALVLIGTLVADLSPLAGLSGLQVLCLNNTSVNDLSPLAGLPHLRYLFLANTAVADLSPLIPLGNLLVLEISGVKAPIPEALRKRPGLRIIGP